MYYLKSMYLTAWKNYAKTAYSSHDWEENQEANVKNYYVGQCADWLMCIGPKRSQIRAAIRIAEEDARRYCEDGMGWAAACYEAGARILRAYLGEKNVKDVGSFWG